MLHQVTGRVEGTCWLLPKVAEGELLKSSCAADGAGPALIPQGGGCWNSF